MLLGMIRTPVLTPRRPRPNGNGSTSNGESSPPTGVLLLPRSIGGRRGASGRSAPGLALLVEQPIDGVEDLRRQFEAVDGRRLGLPPVCREAVDEHAFVRHVDALVTQQFGLAARAGLAGGGGG